MKTNNNMIFVRGNNIYNYEEMRIKAAEVIGYRSAPCGEAIVDPKLLSHEHIIKVVEILGLTPSNVS